MSVTIELPVQSQHAVLHVGRCFSAIGVLGGRGLPSPCGTHRPCSRRGRGYGRRIVEVCENCTLSLSLSHCRRLPCTAVVTQRLLVKGTVILTSMMLG